jgi:transposase-like protein
MDTTTRAMIRLPAVRTRRRHAPQFRAQVVAACLQPGVSISAVALANGLNANLVRKWVKEHREGVRSDVVVAEEGGRGRAGREAAPAQFVAVAVEAAPVVSTGDIRLEVRRGETVVHITWPAAQAQACAQWLGAWLR